MKNLLHLVIISVVLVRDSIEQGRIHSNYIKLRYTQILCVGSEHA